MIQKKFVLLSIVFMSASLHLTVSANIAPKPLPCTEKWIPSTTIIWEFNAPMTMCCPKGFSLIQYDINRFVTGLKCIEPV